MIALQTSFHYLGLVAPMFEARLGNHLRAFTIFLKGFK